MKLVATCLFGLEKLLGSEIDTLGLRRIETMDGRVIFEGEPRDIPIDTQLQLLVYTETTYIAQVVTLI